MEKKYLNKKIILVVISLVLITGFIFNLYSSNPLFKTLLVSKTFNKVVFNNYNIEETLDMAKNAVIDEGDLEYGYIIYNDIISKNPDTVDAYTGIALIYERLKNYREAENYIKEAEKRINSSTTPESLIDLYYTEGLIYYGDSVYDKKKRIAAIENFNKALDVKGLNDEWQKYYEEYIYLYLGILYSSMGNDQKANEFYLKSYEINPNDKTIFYTIAITYIDLKEFNRAFDYLVKYKDEYQENSTYLLGMSYYYVEMGNFSEAISYLAKAEEIAKEEDLFKLLYVYGKYYEKTGNLEKAKDSYRKALEKNIYLIVNDYEMPNIVNRLNINIDDIKEQLEKEKEENYNRRIDL